jgi:transcription elongation factor Elf1
MSKSNDTKGTTTRYPCHCCNKKDVVAWSDKRQSFICENCQKVFDSAVIAHRNGVDVEQLSFC